MVIESKRVGNSTSIFLKAFLLDVETFLLHFVMEVKLIDPTEISVFLVSNRFNDLILRPPLKVNI